MHSYLSYFLVKVTLQGLIKFVSAFLPPPFTSRKHGKRNRSRFSIAVLLTIVLSRVAPSVKSCYTCNFHWVPNENITHVHVYVPRAFGVPRTYVYTCHSLIKCMVIALLLVYLLSCNNLLWTTSEGERTSGMNWFFHNVTYQLVVNLGLNSVDVYRKHVYHKKATS